MKKYFANKKRALYILSALLPFTIMVIVFAILGVYPFGNVTIMAIDFASQYIDLFGYLKQAVLSLDFSSFFYSFSKSLGGDMVGLWGYYLLSPFNLLYIIIPIEEIRIAATLTVLFRYAAMGLTFAHLLIKRYGALQKRPLLIPTFATIYALTGFNVAYQMNPLWYDAMVMLPLVIIGVEKVLDGEKAHKYVLALAAMIIFQYYMAYMMCLFIILYSFIYMARKYQGANIKAKLISFFKPILRLGLYSILAVGVSAITLYPIVQNLLISKGTYTETLRWEWAFEFSPLEVLAKLMIGAFDYDQMPSGLPNVYVASIAMIGFVAFFVMKAFRKSEKIAAFLVMTLFVLSMSHDFMNKIWHLGQTPAWFYHRFTYLTSFLMVLLGYRVVSQWEKVNKKGFLFAGVLMLAVNISVYFQAASFMTVYQQLASTVLWSVMLILMARSKTIQTWLFILFVSLVELAGNAYIDQSRIGYAHALAFGNAQTVLTQIIEPIRPKQNEFYRIGKLFNRTKNDPFMYNYPGLTHFSSNMESDTLDLFDNMGDAGANASTNYGSGTPLTDALYGVKYLIQLRNLSSEDRQNPNIYSFTRESTRKDLYAYYQATYESSRFRVYQNDNVLPIAFGVPQAVIDLELKRNQPAQNQNKILQAFAGTDINYFTQYGFSDIALDNMKAESGNLSSSSFTRIDKVREGVVRYTFTPQTNEAYYISVPSSVNKSKSDIQITLNGQVYEYYRTFDQRQLWNVAYNNQGKEIIFEVSTSSLDTLNLYNMQLWKLDSQVTREAIAKRQAQGMTVTYWDNNQIEGTVNITDDSSHLMTSIPYSPGWQVSVDGVAVTPVKVWNSLMAIPISPGNHTIKMVYVPTGFPVGVGISALSLGTLGLIYVFGRRKKDEILQ